MRRLAAGMGLALSLLLAAPPARAGEGVPPTPAEVERLVRALGAESWEERERATERLVEIGKPAHAALRAALESPDAEVRFRARTILRALHRKVADLLSQAALRGGRSQPTFAAVVALGPDALEPIATLARRELTDFRGDETELRLAIAAIEKIGLSGDGAARAPARAALVSLLDLNLRNLAGLIGSALETLGADEARAALAERLRADDTAVRRNAVRVLGEIGGLETVRALEPALADTDASVRAEGVRALVRATRARGAAVRRAAADLVLRLLDDGDAGVRARAIQAAGEFRDTRAAPRLREILAKAAPAGPEPAFGAADVHVSAAIAALGRIGDRESIPALLEALERPELADAAVEALGRLGAREAVPALVGLLEKGGVVSPIQVVRALGRIGDARALPALEARYQKNDGSRQQVVTAIGRIEGKEAVAFLVARAKAADDEVEVAAALAALARRGDAGAELGEAAVAALARQPVMLKIEAMRIIGKARYAPALDAVARLLSSSDPRVRRQAVDTLAAIGDPRAVGPLRPLADADDADLRERARLALAKLGEDGPLRKTIAAREEALAKAIAGGDADAIREERFELGLAYLYARENAKGAEQFAAILEGIEPDDRFADTSAYNLACAKSLLGEKEAAVAALRRAVELGFDDWRHMEADTDLDPIRDTPEVREIMAELQRAHPRGFSFDESWLVPPDERFFEDALELDGAVE